MDAERIRRMAAESAALQRSFFDANAEGVLLAGRAMADALARGAKVLAFGNGGSAADAQHLVAELVGRFRGARAPLPALALSSDPSVISSLANDFGYEAVFARQVEAHGRTGDVAVGISTSGRSPNVVQALTLARERGLVTLGLTGQGGGALAGRVDHLLAVASRETPRVQEVHAIVVHLLCEVVEEAFLRG